MEQVPMYTFAQIYAEENDLQLAFTFSLSSECKLGQIVHSVQALNKSIFGVATETKVNSNY